MRILYLHQYFTTPSMSGGTRSYEMARRLVQFGHDVHLITSDRAGTGRAWRETNEAGIHVHWYPVPYSNHMSYGARLRSFFRFAWHAARRAGSLAGDVVFASSTPLTIVLPAVRAARQQSIPMVFEVRDLWPETPIAVGALNHPLLIAAARRLERFAYRNAAEIIALSPDMKGGIAATGYPEDRITVIPNSSDLALFSAPQSEGQAYRRAREWLGDRPLVVYTGAMGAVNGVDYLVHLAAAVAVRDPEIRFLVIGSGREEAKVRQTAQDRGILDRNFFLEPAIPKTEIPAVLSAADLATSTVIDRPGLWANSANKVFDALAASRPIAINHEGWLAEMIRETGCGLVLPPNDFERAADDLITALRDPAWVAMARSAARRVGRERFDRDVLARQLESVLLRVVPKKRLRQAA